MTPKELMELSDEQLMALGEKESRAAYRVKVVTLELLADISETLIRIEELLGKLIYER